MMVTLNKRTKTGIRIGFLISLLISFFLLYNYTSVGDWLSVEYLEESMKKSGWWGMTMFFIVFLVGTLMNIPCAVFLIFSFFVYGYFWGFMISYVAAVWSSMMNFYFARWIGGKALDEIKNKKMRKILAKAEARPVFTTVWLRLVFLMSPIVNYALALTNIRAKHFFWGNVIGMVPPMLVFLLGTVMFQSEYFNELWVAWFG